MKLSPEDREALKRMLGQVWGVIGLDIQQSCQAANTRLLASNVRESVMDFVSLYGHDPKLVTLWQSLSWSLKDKLLREEFPKGNY